MAAIQGLTPADSQFHRPGRIDMLLGADVLPYVQTRSGPESSIMAVETVFGHAFMGTYQSAAPEKTTTASIQLATSQSNSASDDSLSKALTKFWEVEEPPMEKQPFTSEEKRVQSEYALTHSFNPTAGKYQVVLPRKTEDLKLGESKSRALQRYYSIERALQRKGTWAKFQQVVQIWTMPGSVHQKSYYSLQVRHTTLPMHSVSKASSSTTKLRVVFDASAPTTSGLSLNDTLAVGPMLHPTLDQILLRFRSYRVALTGDIGKMYREILLSPPDQQYHRFMWRAQQAASDFGQEYPRAQYHIHNSFDLLGGADSVKGAVALQQQLTQVLTQRKFRSSSAKVLKEIPPELVEPMPKKELVDCHSCSYPKALGVRWDSVKDTMSTDVQLKGSLPLLRGAY